MDYTQPARKFLEAGYSVIPLQLDGSKSPVGSWKPYQTRRATEHELVQWFGNGQPCGLGVVAGGVSGNLHILDFDHQAEQIFERFWNDAERQLPGISQRLVVVATPRPGRQVWFRQTSAPPGNQILAYSDPLPTGEQDADGDPALQPQVLVETRGSGGYVAAAGSHPAVHKTGRPYELIHGRVENLPMLANQEAEQLLNICRSFRQYEPQRVQWKPSEPYTGEPRPGDIYNRHGSIPELLKKHGWQLHHVDVDGVEHWTRPGKDTADGSSATVGHLVDEAGRPLLYVFSSGAKPFRPNHAYDSFAVFTHLDHGGDFSTAASAAREMYAAEVQAAQAAHYQLDQKQPYTPFPVHLLPPVVADYVQAHSDSLNVDAGFVAVPILPVLAGLIGQTRKLYVKRNWTESAILWACTVAGVSTGKTPGWQAATEPAQQIERRLNDIRRSHQLEYEQAVRQYKQAKAAGEKPSWTPERPEFSTQLTVDDCTMETLADIHQKNWRGLLQCVDELAGWLRGFDMYRQGKGRDVENWLSIYVGRHLQVSRKTDNYRIYLPSTAISVVGTIQPDVAAVTLFSERFVANGFAARVLSASPPGELVRWSDREVSEEVDAAMFQLADRLFELTGEQYESDRFRSICLPFTDAARRLFRQYIEDTADHAGSLDEPLRSAWAKLRPAAARFALVFSVVKQLIHNPEGNALQPVDAESTAAGIQLAWWFGNELSRNYLFGEKEAPDSLDSHLQWIRKKHTQGITARELQQGRRRITTAEQAKQVLQKLVDAEQGCWQHGGFVPF